MCLTQKQWCRVSAKMERLPLLCSSPLLSSCALSGIPLELGGTCQAVYHSPAGAIVWNIPEVLSEATDHCLICGCWTPITTPSFSSAFPFALLLCPSPSHYSPHSPSSYHFLLSLFPGARRQTKQLFCGVISRWWSPPQKPLQPSCAVTVEFYVPSFPFASFNRIFLIVVSASKNRLGRWMFDNNTG